MPVRDASEPQLFFKKKFLPVRDAAEPQNGPNTHPDVIVCERGLVSGVRERFGEEEVSERGLVRGVGTV